MKIQGPGEKRSREVAAMNQSEQNVAAVHRVPGSEPGAGSGPGFPHWQSGVSPDNGTRLAWKPKQRAAFEGPRAGAE